MLARRLHSLSCALRHPRPALRPRWPGSAQCRAIATTPTQASASSTKDWLGELEGGGSRYSVSVRPEDYSLIVYPGAAYPDGVDHDALLASEHKAFVIASLMNPDRLEQVLGRPFAVAPAVVRDFDLIRATVDDLTMPFMVPTPGAIRNGVVILDMDAEAAAALEKLEEFHPASGARVRQAVEVDVRVGDVEMRVGSFIKA